MSTLHSKHPPRNRLAKPLPAEWRQKLLEAGVPRRKYSAICRVTLAGGRVIEDLIVEQGWIVGLDRSQLVGEAEQRIDFNPSLILEMDIKQVV